MRKLTKKYIEELSYEIIGAAIEIHKELGPGLLESIYEKCMIYELELRGLDVKHQQSVPIIYKDMTFDANLRYDLLVEECIIVELKALAQMLPIHDAQAMSYAHLLKVPKSILINFTTTNIFQYGQKTFVNKFFKMLPAI